MIYFVIDLYTIVKRINVIIVMLCFLIVKKLHTHIIDRHMFYACFFCGNGFQTEPELYKHQTQHCLRSFSCSHCNDKFDSLRSCQKHELQTHGHFGISTEAIPTIRAQHKFVNKLKNLTKPWEKDVDQIISKHPYYMDHVHRIIEKTQDKLSKRGLLDGRGRPINVHEGSIYDNIVKHSNRKVRNEHIERLEKTYLDHASEIMTHSQRGTDGQMLKYNIHLLDEDPFNEQIESILNKIYMENESNLPYKLAMQFGFLLFNPKPGKYNYWYANVHLSNYTDTGQKTDILQQSNIWEIHSMADIHSCLNDIANTDFFTMLRNAFEESSNVINGATNVLIQIFPMAQNDIGRGIRDEFEQEDDDEDEEDDTRSKFDEFDDDENDHEDEDDDDDKPTDEKSLVLRFMNINLRNKNLYSSRNKQNKCFFDCLAVNELLHEEGGNNIEAFFKDSTVNDRIMEKSKEMFDMYCDTHGLSDVTKSIFNGVHLKLIPILAHLFHCRVDVYSISKQGTELVFDLIRGAKSNFVYNAKKAMTLLFYENHYYLLLRKDQVFKRFRCLLCGNQFTKAANLKRHFQTERCTFLKTKRIYAKGCVETSRLLLSKIKDTFNVPDNIIPPLLYLERDNTQENKLLHPTENDLYFTKKFATYDFESKLTKTTIAEIRERNFTSIANSASET